MDKQTNQTLDRRIAAAFTENATSADLGQLYVDVQAALSDLEAQAQAARQRWLDPTESDAPGARREAEDAESGAERLRAILPKLEARYHEVRADEERAAWLPQYEQTKAEVDVLAAEYADNYPKLVEQMIDLFQRAAAVDQKVEAVNSAAANLVGEHRRLKGVELTARGLDGFTAINPSLAKETRLPHFEKSSQAAWPPRQVPASLRLVEALAPAIASFGTPANDLAGYRAAQDAARRAEAEQSAAYYRRLNERRAQEGRAARNAARIEAHEAMLRGG